MSCDYQSRGYRPWIVLTLLGVAVCAPIASLSGFWQLRVVSSAFAATPNLATTNVPEATNVLEATIETANGEQMSCNSTHPVLCIYANRNWVSYLEQGFGATRYSSESQQGREETDELANPSHRSPTPADLGRKIRFLNQLKTWLDAIS